MEILTLQVGHYSNFIGTHFWNLQGNQLRQEALANEAVFKTNNPLVSSDASDPRILCRESTDKYGQNILVPRLISIDLKGSLNQLKQDGSIGNDELQTNEVQKLSSQCERIDNESLQWSQGHENSSDSSVRASSAMAEKNIGLTEKGTIVWSDYLTTQYHPQSILLIEGLIRQAGLSTFSSYGSGLASSRDVNNLDQLEDKLHFFLEECDNLQGIQIFADVDNGFGGFTSGLLEQVQDIAGKKCIFTFSNWAPSTEIDFADLNSSLALNSMIQQSELVFPMSSRRSLSWKTLESAVFPQLNYKEESYYETSALLATYIDTFTLPCRTKKADITSLNNLSTFITIGSQKAASCGLSLPFTSMCLLQPSQGPSQSCVTDITPYSYCRSYPGSYGEVTILRGRSRMNSYGPNVSGSSNKGTKHPIPEEFNWMFESSCDTYTAKRYRFDSCISTASPYPQYFQASVSGDVFATQDSVPSTKSVTSVATLAKASPSKSLYDLFFNLYVNSRRLRKPVLNSFLESGMELGDIKEALEEILCQAESYDASRRDFNDYNAGAFHF